MDDAPKIVRTESVSPEGIQVVNDAAEDKPHAPLGADEFEMPILPTPEAAFATEAEATRIACIPPEPANAAPEPDVSSMLRSKRQSFAIAAEFIDHFLVASRPSSMAAAT